ncbi:MAG: pyridoxamine 5'-phosphate oxidase family protein [Acidimicrobiales bacterium]
MGKTYEHIEAVLAEWLVAQPVFFVATSPLAADGSINCSPKGNRGEFAVLGERTVAYLDQTGSGVETIAHLRENGRIVVMFCAFAGPPRIVRLHGTGRVVTTAMAEFADVACAFPGGAGVGVRSVIVVDVSRISDSCGYGVPLMSFEGHRPTMDQWSARKGPEGIRNYWSEKNAVSIDNLEGLSDPEKAPSEGPNGANAEKVVSGD